MKKLLILFIGLLFSFSAFAQDHSTAAGLWQTYDGGKPGGKPTGMVEIYEENNVWYGKIAGNSDPEEAKKVSYCTKCPDEFKDKPFDGLRFMWGFTRNENNYTGGHILDPNTGNIYNASMNLVDDGKTLKMRGYLGISIFGQTETWTRIK